MKRGKTVHVVLWNGETTPGTVLRSRRAASGQGREFFVRTAHWPAGQWVSNVRRVAA